MRVLVAVAALLPILIEAIVKLLLRPRPFWVHYYDPEVIYFVQGLRLLRAEVPSNIDHPGTPLQVLSALLTAITGPSLLDFERFVVVAHVLMFLAHAAAVMLLLHTVLRELPAMMQVVAIWAYLLAPHALERLDVWSPEGLYLPIGAVALAALWWWWRTPTRRSALLLGVVLGVGVATKLLLLAWAGAAVAAALGSRRVRDTIFMGLGLIGGFAAGTLPIASEWGRMISRHPQEQSWLALLATAKSWLVWLVLVAVLVVVGWRRLRRPLAIFGVVTIVLICLGIRSNPSFHYLLPWALAVTALLASATEHTTQRVQWALLFVCAVFLGRALWNDIAVHHRRIDEAERIQSRIAEIVGPAVTVYSWRVPHPSFALRIMTDDPRDHLEVARRYPRDGVYTWERTVLLPPGATRWDYLVITPEQLRNFPHPVGQAVGMAGPYAVVQNF
jgi:hypothetical protein